MKVIKMKRKALAILMSLAMAFTMMPMMGSPAHAVLSTIELDGGSYTLAGNNQLVKDGDTGDEISIHSDQNITFTGNTVIKLDGHELECASIKSGFEKPSDPDIAKHPWYSYDLTIDGGDTGGSIHIGDPNMDDYALTANNLAIRNLSEESSVACLKEEGNKVAIFAKNDLRIEGIKKYLGICGAIGMEAREGKTNISDVSDLIDVNAMRIGIDTDDTNNNDIKISSSHVVIDVQGWDGHCIDSGWKKGGISITDSIVEMSNSNNNEPDSNSKGGYNALNTSGTVNIKDSCVTAENAQKDRPAMLVHEDTGKLIISGESLVACQNVEGGSASALMANAIELKDGNRLFMPKDGSIGKTKYNGGSGEKEMYTVFDKDGNTSERVGFGSGKELIHTVSAPRKVFPGTPIHMSGVLKDENGDPVHDAFLLIEYEKTFSREVITNDQGIWEYKGGAFTPSDPGEVSFRIHYFGVYVAGESPVKGYVRYLPPSESPCVKVEVISEGSVETLKGLELTDPPEGESRKTEYKCGEAFDLDASYVKAIINRQNNSGESEEVKVDLEPSSTIITPSVLKYGMEKVNINYLFEGDMASLDYPVTVSHDWSTEWRKDGDKHWHECSGCHEKKDEAVHIWDAGKVTKTSTTAATGTKTYTCTVCKVTKTKTIPKLAKKANPLKVKGKTAGIKYKKLKKKAQTLAVGKVIKFTKKGQGKMSYKKASVVYTKAKAVKMSKKALKKYTNKAEKKITINAKTGKVTFKKGLKKGTYKVKVKVKAAGNISYKASAWKTVTVKIKVK